MKLVLSPMVDVTHAAFRELVALIGGPSLFITEMISSRALMSTPPEKDPYLIPGEHDRPLVAQLAGSTPEEFERAVEKIESLSWIAGYNINMGCTKAVVRYGWGVALLDEPEKVRRIIKAIRQVTEKPISVKLRSPKGHNLKRLFALFDVFESEGIDFVIFHPRSPEDGFKRPARWGELKEVKKRFSVELYGNGDVFSPLDARRIVEETGVDGVAVGRAAAIRPWIIRDISAFLKGGTIPEPPPMEDILILFSSLIKKFLPERWWERRLIQFLGWFLQNLDHAHYYFSAVKKIQGFEEKIKESLSFIKGKKPKPYPVSPFLPI